jgi:hypothetical protein
VPFAPVPFNSSNRRDGGGFLLYAVGPNGKDDGGRAFDSKPPAADVILKISGDRWAKP